MSISRPLLPDEVAPLMVASGSRQGGLAMTEHAASPNSPSGDSWSIPRLAELAALEADWDSYGAPPITLAALRRVDGVLICPTSDGGIDLEFHDQNGSQVNVVIGPHGWVESVYVSDTGKRVTVEVDR